MLQRNIAKFGHQRRIVNFVFQGTVRASPLRNYYYADARFSVRNHGFIETVFADDFNCWTSLDKDVTEADAILKLSGCQHSLHRWGAAKRVTFDIKKEAFIIIRPRKSFGARLSVARRDF